MRTPMPPSIESICPAHGLVRRPAGGRIPEFAARLLASDYVLGQRRRVSVQVALAEFDGVDRRASRPSTPSTSRSLVDLL